MKHNLKITILILGMFILTQFIGIYVIDHYLNEGNNLPYGLEPPQIDKQSDYSILFGAIIFAFVIAIFLFLFLKKFKIELILKLWFFVVATIALSISFFSVTRTFDKLIFGIPLIAVVVALFLTILKIYKRNFLAHNFSELLIYPGIAAVFVPLLNVYTIIGLLILISIYDMWAVWHSGVMQKMAKYQIDKLKIFSGFFVPYVSKNVRKKMKMWKKTLKKSELKKKKIKVNVAILGGGDIVFPIITAGVMLKTLGLGSAIFVIIGAALGLGYLFFFSEKKKFYPAMPFITAGIFVGIALSYLIF
ncbi:MAG TPA: presenilin family intramembrane aspartyl protease [Bacillota bacterium]|nr:presenilin family intramembrane aspartyl protease [Bacillota bacterium]